MHSPTNSIEPGQEIDFQAQQDNKRSHGSSRSRERQQKKKHHDSRSNSNHNKFNTNNNRSDDSEEENNRNNNNNRYRRQRHKYQDSSRSPRSQGEPSDNQSLGEDKGVTLYFSNLDPKLKEDDLKKYFKKYGTIDSLDIIRYPYTNESRGYGFISYENKQDGLKCLAEMNGKDINGFKVKLEKSKRREARQKTPGQYLGYNPPRFTGRKRSPFQDRYNPRYRNQRKFSRSRSHSHGRKRQSRSRSQERRRYPDFRRYNNYNNSSNNRYREDSRERYNRGDRVRGNFFNRQREYSPDRKREKSNDRDRSRQQQNFKRSIERSSSPKQFSSNRN